MSDIQKGTLYLCATPIGNLEDITLRVLRVLEEVDLIAAEDTRNTIHLLNHFSIRTPLTSYHEFNKIDKAYELAGQLAQGKSIALVTDAGMPGISDPGESLVRICAERGLPVTVLPGACACVSALAVSGLPTGRFAFEGFLPREKKERAAALRNLQNETRTLLIYEAPHRLRRTLQELFDTLGDRRISLCRELTKKYETVLRMTLSEAVTYYEVNEPRGEYVLVIDGRDPADLAAEDAQSWGSMDIRDHMTLYTSQGLDKKEAMKQVARDRGIGKREVYQALLDSEVE